MSENKIIKTYLSLESKYKVMIEKLSLVPSGIIFLDKVDFLIITPFIKIDKHVKKYIYDNRKDQAFIKATAKYHRNPHLYNNSTDDNNFQLYIDILGLDQATLNKEELALLAADFKNPDAVYLYGLYLLKHTQTPTEDLCPMFKLNYNVNGHADSLTEYLHLDKTLTDEKRVEYLRKEYEKTGRLIEPYSHLLTKLYMKNDTNTKDLEYIVNLVQEECEVNPSNDVMFEILKTLKEALWFKESTEKHKSVMLKLIEAFQKGDMDSIVNDVTERFVLDESQSKKLKEDLDTNEQMKTELSEIINFFNNKY